MAQEGGPFEGAKERLPPSSTWKKEINLFESLST
jgi:hypothetical protein